MDHADARPGDLPRADDGRAVSDARWQPRAAGPPPRVDDAPAPSGAHRWLPRARPARDAPAATPADTGAEGVAEASPWDPAPAGAAEWSLPTTTPAPASPAADPAPSAEEEAAPEAGPGDAPPAATGTTAPEQPAPAASRWSVAPRAAAAPSQDGPDEPPTAPASGVAPGLAGDRPTAPGSDWTVVPSSTPGPADEQRPATASRWAVPATGRAVHAAPDDDGQPSAAATSAADAPSDPGDVAEHEAPVPDPAASKDVAGGPEPRGGNRWRARKHG